MLIMRIVMLELRDWNLDENPLGYPDGPETEIGPPCRMQTQERKLWKF